MYIKVHNSLTDKAGKARQGEGKKKETFARGGGGELTTVFMYIGKIVEIYVCVYVCPSQ